MWGNDFIYGSGGIHCCLDCEERHSDCHSECEKYKKEKEEHVEEVRKRNKEKNDAAKADEVIFRRWR